MAKNWFPLGATGSASLHFQGDWLFDDGAVSPQMQYCSTNSHGADPMGARGTSAGYPADTAVAIVMIRSIPLAAQTIGGTFDLCLGVSLAPAYPQYPGAPDPFLHPAYWAVHIWVSVGDSNDVRGTVLDNYREGVGELYDGPNHWPNSVDDGGQIMDGPQFRSLLASQTLTSLDIQAGDRLIIELGFIARPEGPSFGPYAHHIQGGITGGVFAEGTARGIPGNSDVDAAQGFLRFSRAVVPMESDQDVCVHECECCVATKMSVINQALFKIGVSQTIEALDEESREAFTGVALFDGVLKEVLRRFPWAFATKYATSVDAEEDDPMELLAGTSTEPANRDWQYAYRYPDDCMFARRLVREGVGRRFDPTPPPFRVGRLTIEGDGVQVIFTDEADAELEYTMYVECAENFNDAIFEDALSWLQAAKMAPSMSRIDKMDQKALAMYEALFATAATVSAREQQQPASGDAEWITGR